MLELLSLAVAFIALIVAQRAHGRIAWLQRRIATLEAGQGAPLAETLAEIPAPPVETSEPAPEAPPVPARPIVPRKAPPAILARFLPWLKANWIYPVAGLALVMAAVFLVQYSIEKGLLSPALRIALAVALGMALIGAAEALRRRWGAGQAGLVPATLAGAGVFTLFAAVLAAYHLYAMLGAETALLALAIVAAGAMALGWVHGPMLAAMGVLGCTAAPFLLGGGGPPPVLLHGYFGAVAALGLGIDGLRRWGWISILAVLLPLGGGVLIAMGGAPDWGLALLALWVAGLGTALPGGRLVPGAGGAMLHRWRARPSPEVIAAGLAVLGATLAILTQIKAPESLLAMGALAILLPLWTARAPALSDLSLIPALGLPLAVPLAGLMTPLLLALVLNVQGWLPQGAVALAVLAGLAMLWRSERDGGLARDLWAILAVATPGATLIAVEVFWQPMTLLGAGWPLSVMALAGAYTALALWAARRDGGQGARLGAAAAAAIAMIALSLMLVLSAAALTVALAVLLVATAAMDRRFDIPYLGWILGLGTMAMGWRLLIDPGLDPILLRELSALDTWLTLLAALAGPFAALLLIRTLPPHPARDWGRIIAETGLSGLVPVVLALAIARFLDGLSPHASLGLQASVLIALASVQLARARALPGSRAMLWVRRGLAAFLGLGAGLCLLAGLTLFSPLAGIGFLGAPVRGWPVINDLALAYLAPALALAWALRHHPRARLIAAIPGVTWLALVIRHLWHGGERMGLETGFAQGELYAYTVALLLAGAAALALALRLGVTGYRIAGLALIGLAAAKAFLVDASGLTGLMRVGAFLALGLSLVGLAWLNTWVTARMTGAAAEDPEGAIR